MLYMSIGETKLCMSRKYVGGAPGRCTYSIQFMTDHIYDNFYRKISDDSVQYWLPHTDEFRLAIWLKLNEGYTVGEHHDASGSKSNLTWFIFLSIH